MRLLKLYSQSRRCLDGLPVTECHGHVDTLDPLLKRVARNGNQSVPKVRIYKPT